MQAIVLVGGEGTRLRPLTLTVPKPALTLVDRPFLAYMVEWLAGHGVTEVVLACGFLPDALREALAGEEDRAGVAIRYAVEPEPRGTAGAIRWNIESAMRSLMTTLPGGAVPPAAVTSASVTTRPAYFSLASS